MLVSLRSVRMAGSIVVALALARGVLATPAPEPAAAAATPAALVSVVGEVTALDAAGALLTLRGDDGVTTVVASDAATRVVRAKPGAKDLKDAVAITLGDIHVGDRVLARLGAAEGTRVAARLVVMARTDLEEKEQRERGEWRRRGIVGTVSAIDPQTHEITIEQRSFSGSRPVVLAAGGAGVGFRRYAADSVRFRDAKPSSLAEIQIGDQVRALGERADEGARFVAEQVVSGAFRPVTGVITSLAPERSQIGIRDMTTGAEVLVTLSASAQLRRLPSEVGAMFLGQRGAEGGGAGGGKGADSAGRGASSEHGGPGAMGGRGGMGGGPGDMLERLPTIAIGELKLGDRVVVSTSATSEPGKLVGVALLSGLESLVPAGASRRGGAPFDVGLPAGILDMGIGASP